MPIGKLSAVLVPLLLAVKHYFLLKTSLFLAPTRHCDVRAAVRPRCAGEEAGPCEETGAESISSGIHSKKKLVRLVILAMLSTYA